MTGRLLDSYDIVKEQSITHFLDNPKQDKETYSHPNMGILWRKVVLLV